MRVTLVAINAMYQHTSLALRLLSAAARGLPITHTPLELHCNMRYEAMFRAVYETKPDVLCFSCMIWNIESVLRLIRDVRKARPDTRIVVGGPEVSFDADTFLRDCPEMDAVVCGEGELSYPALLSAFLRGENGEGIAGVCLRGAPGADMRSLSAQPELAGTLFAYEAEAAYDPGRIWYAETARGCPFRCQFCLSSIQPGVRALSADDAVSLLRGMAQKGARLVKLVDRTFNFDKKRAIAIWKALLDTPHCVYHFEIEPSLLDAETLSFLETVPEGRFQFEIGIQSTNPETLASVDRSLPLERVREAVQRLGAARNIPLHLDLIAGLPHEGYDTFAASFDAVFSLGPTALQVGFLKLLRGSGLRQSAKRHGIVYSDSPPYEVLFTDWLSQDDILRLKDIAQAVEWYHNSGKYKATMALLLGQAESPFAVFAQLAQSLRTQGVFSAPKGQPDRLAALLMSGCQMISKAYVPLLHEAACFDGLMQDIPIASLPASCRLSASTDQGSAYLRGAFPRYETRRQYSVVRCGFDPEALLCAHVVREACAYVLIHRKSAAYERIMP